MRVLLVEDDPMIAQGLQVGLRQSGFAVDWVPDGAAAQAARERQANLTKPQGSLGRLEDLAVFMAGWRATPRPGGSA